MKYGAERFKIYLFNKAITLFSHLILKECLNYESVSRT